MEKHRSGHIVQIATSLDEHADAPVPPVLAAASFVTGEILHVDAGQSAGH
jgi:hypothetical protein